ncbi:hypothetical protein E2C01_101499 [Portunus trituberculatus]|uniref:Uncharacterized protein n=1 Tax=Portunus trituberculatus TaxID=210409 RepID=A0A5B7KKK8_PORTR|nr:hypothetical protein [Portunus trituberculatus]
MVCVCEAKLKNKNSLSESTITTATTAATRTARRRNKAGTVLRPPPAARSHSVGDHRTHTTRHYSLPTPSGTYTQAFTVYTSTSIPSTQVPLIAIRYTCHSPHQGNEPMLFNY